VISTASSGRRHPAYTKCSAFAAGYLSSSFCKLPLLTAAATLANPSRTNASPIYLILFISATYVLNRPCVYCSLLLAVLVISLFDFHSNWFEPHYAHPSTLFSPGSMTGTVPDALSGSLPGSLASTIDVVTAVVKGTAASLSAGITGRGVESGSSAAVEWIGRILRREWRIDCLDVAIRL
jgi:hypothetical protein